MGAALPSLVRWGLSPDADLVYRTLVSLDTAREGQLAHELGLPHERIREAVRELAEAGAIRRVSSTSRRSPKATGRAVWAARQPNQVVGHLHVNRPRVFRVPPVPPPTDTGRPAGAPDPVVPAIRPVTVVPVPPIAAAPPPAAPPACEDNVDSSAPVTVLAVPRAVDIEPLTDLDEEPAEAAPVPRQSKAPDRAAQPPRTGRAQIAPPPHWHLLPASWQNSAAQREQPQVTLTPRERAIVGLLAQGHTDETAARELDLSRRTVGYALGGLMSRLGVENRFQLGLALGALRAAVPAPRERSEP